MKRTRRLCSFGCLLIMATLSGCRSAEPEVDPEPGVALDLATARAKAITNLRYQLSFDIPAAADQPVTGRETIRFTATDTSQPLVLDFDPGSDDNVISLSVGGSSSRFRTVNGHIVVPAGDLAVGENTIEITFRAGNLPLNRNPDFLYSLFVPARAHLAFPCFDQPDLKARYTLELTVPADWQAVANGQEISRDTAGNRTHIKYSETQLIPTYLLAFAAGKFQIETAERNGRTYRMFHRETDAAKLARNRDAVFDLHASALAWLEQYTAIPYQFGKFDFMAIPSFQFSGMEHPGAVYYNSSSILLDESATENQMLNRASIIAHETSHMWFGDLVTMRWFNDVWMKEVFANFMAAKIVNPSFPKVNHELRFLVSNYPSAYSVDRTTGTHPIRQELDNLSDAGTLYGPIIYQKAPIVMRLLERMLGPEKMQEGLRVYLKQFQFGNATWLDLVQVLDDRTDRDLAAWSRVWVERAGRPSLLTTIDADPAGRVQRIGLLQTPSESPTSGQTLWTEQIQVLVGLQDGVRSLPVEVSGPFTEVPGSKGLAGVRFVLPNGGGIAYGDITLDERSRTYLLDHVSELADPVSRGAAWVALWEETLDGRVKAPAFIDAALHALPRENTEQNVQLLLGYVSRAFWRFLPTAMRAERAAILERLLRDGITRAQSSSLKSTYFSAFRSVVTTPEGVSFLERVWRLQEKIPGLTLAEPDEATMALELAVRGVPDAAAVLEEQRGRFTNPDRKARFEFVMPALSESAETRDRFFETLRDVKNRRREPWVVEGLAYLNHPLREGTSLKYVRPSLQLLEEIQRTGDIFFPTNWMNAALGGQRTTEAAMIVRTFLVERADYPIRMRRVILQQADDLFRAAAVGPR
jgi:aminopeptidase N